MGSLKDLTGKRFGRWTVLRLSKTRLHGRVSWDCVCDCGTEKAVCGTNIRRSLSCGCYRDEVMSRIFKRHGMSETLEYFAYKGAKNRCTNPNEEQWMDYGGRGIEFRFTSFEQFYEVVGPKPVPHPEEGAYSIDRIDVDGHYEPGNVRWATRRMQKFNTRKEVKAAKYDELIEFAKKEDWKHIIDILKEASGNLRAA